MRDDSVDCSEISRIQRSWTSEDIQDYIRGLPIWTGAVEVTQHFGGLTNRTYFATDGDGKRYAIRCGVDQYRTRQTSVVQCTLAAHKLGVGPALRYWEPNLTITDFIASPVMTEEQLKEPAMMAHVIERMKLLHTNSDAIAETISYWWPFHTIRRYLNTMEQGVAATDFQPSAWVGDVPYFRDVTDRLERAIRPFIPVFTHNDLAYVNMMFNSKGEVLFIDWDAGAYGNPKSDIADMLTWIDADEAMDRYAVAAYFTDADAAEIEATLHEIRAFKMMSMLRVLGEVMITLLDPDYFVSPQEYAIGMKEYFPNEEPRLAGLIDMLRPQFGRDWARYGANYL